MESLSSVSTIAKDIAVAMPTVSRNNRLHKISKRAQGIADLLRELDAVTAGTKTDAARQRLLGNLQEMLSDALRQVRSWQGSSYPRKLITSRRMSDEFDDMDGEIDHCLLNLSLANRILIACLEKQLHQNVAASREMVTLRIGMPRDDNVDRIERCIRTIQDL